MAVHCLKATSLGARGRTADGHGGMSSQLVTSLSLVESSGRNPDFSCVGKHILVMVLPVHKAWHTQALLQLQLRVS